MNEIKLPNQFNSDGFTLTLVERRSDRAIFAQSKNGRVLSYEAVIISHLPDRLAPNGDTIPASERYPSPSQWGKRAWTVTSIERAYQKLGWPTEPVTVPIQNK